MSESKLFKGIVIGATTGAIISMLDRKTRKHTIETVTKVKDTITYFVKNREELEVFIEEKIEDVQELYEKTTNNINMIVNKIDELKEIPESVQVLVDDTKNAFSQRDELN